MHSMRVARLAKPEDCYCAKSIWLSHVCRGVLGDRKPGLTPWGGSVLDSVVGAFLVCFLLYSLSRLHCQKPPNV